MTLTLSYIAEKAEKRKVAVKQFIMDNKVVVGVGNIYANESLFLVKNPSFAICKQSNKRRMDLVNR